MKGIVPKVNDMNAPKGSIKDSPKGFNSKDCPRTTTYIERRNKLHNAK